MYDKMGIQVKQICKKQFPRTQSSQLVQNAYNVVLIVSNVVQYVLLHGTTSETPGPKGSNFDRYWTG